MMPLPHEGTKTQSSVWPGWERPYGAVRGSWGEWGAHIISAEMLNGIGIGQDVSGQLLLLLGGLEDQAPFAEPDDVLLHQVQVHGLHEFLGRQRPGK